MCVIKKLLIQIILHLVIIHCLAHSDSDVSDKINSSNIGKTSFKPIFIYSTALSNAKTINFTKRNELQTINNKSQLIGNNNNNNNNNSNSNNSAKENFDIDALMQMLDNDNHTITSLLLDYFFDYGNTITSHGNDSSGSEIIYFTVDDVQDQTEARGRNRRRNQRRTKQIKVKKKYKKFLLPLLLAYKLKFFALIPIIISGLVLLTGSTGLAGFFFALFAAVMGLKSKHH